MSEIDKVIESVTSLEKTVDSLVDTLADNEKAIKGTGRAYIDYEKKIRKVRSSYLEYQKATRKGVEGILQLKNAIKDNNHNFSIYSKNINVAIKSLTELAKKDKQAAEAQKFLNAEVEKATRTFSGHISKLQEHANTIKGVMGIGAKYAQVMGAQALTFSSITKTLLKDNQGLFDLKRTSKVAGRGTADLSKAMNIFQKNTTFSTVKAIGFANSIHKTYLGIKPTTTAIANLASAIQREFGPSVERAIEVSNDFMAIQNKMPQLYDNIISAHGKMVSALDSGNKSAMQSAEAMGAANIGVLLGMGAASGEIEKVIRFQAALGEGQDGLLDTNKETAKVAQTAEDALLAMGKKAEGAIKLLAKTTQGFYKLLQAIPGTATMAAASFGLIDIAANKNFITIGRLIKQQMTLNSVRSVGAMGAANTLTNFQTGKGQFSPSGSPPPIPKSALPPVSGFTKSVQGLKAPLAGFAKGALKMGGAAAVLTLATNALADVAYFTNEETKKRIDKEFQDATETNNKFVNAIGEFKMFFSHPLVIIAKIQEDFKTAGKSAVAAIKERRYESEVQSRSGGEGSAVYLKAKQDYLKGDIKFQKILNKYRDKETGIIRRTAEYQNAEMKALSKFHRVVDRVVKSEKNINEAKKAGISYEQAAYIHISKAEKSYAKQLKTQREQREEAAKLVLDYMRISKNLEVRLGLENQIAQNFAKQIGWAKELGILTQGALAEKLQQEKEAAKVAEDALKNVGKLSVLAKEITKGTGIEVKFFGKNADPKEMQKEFSRVRSELSALEEPAVKKIRKEVDLKHDKKIAATVDPEERKQKVEDKRLEMETKILEVQQRSLGIMSLQRQITDATTTAKGKSRDVTLAETAANMDTVTQQEKYNSIFEQRLNTQRQLMESAQFGLGASVTMMQKQVDLAAERINQLKQYDVNARKNLDIDHGVSAEMTYQLDNAKNFSEVQGVIARIKGVIANETTDTTKIAGKQEAAEKSILQYVENHSKKSNEIMQQQQKIYNLTKEVREGYLDAIREMAVGAGEFSKIIGTQEMGVTQLMKGVKDVTGLAKLNTMVLGGLQEQTLTKEGVGTEVAYKHTTSGLQKNIEAEAEKQKLGRVYKYGESREEAEKRMRGESTKGSRMGTGVAAGERDKDALKEGASEGTEKGVISAFKKMGYSGRNVMQGFVGDPHSLPAREAPRPGYIAGVSKFARDQSASAAGEVADPTGGYTMAGRMNVPGYARTDSRRTRNVGRGRVAGVSAEDMSISKERMSLHAAYRGTEKSIAQENKYTKEIKRLEKRVSSFKESDPRLIDARKQIRVKESALKKLQEPRYQALKKAYNQTGEVHFRSTEDPLYQENKNIKGAGIAENLKKGLQASGFRKKQRKDKIDRDTAQRQGQDKAQTQSSKYKQSLENRRKKLQGQLGKIGVNEKAYQKEHGEADMKKWEEDYNKAEYVTRKGRFSQTSGMAKKNLSPKAKERLRKTYQKEEAAKRKRRRTSLQRGIRDIGFALEPRKKLSPGQQRVQSTAQQFRAGAKGAKGPRDIYRSATMQGLHGVDFGELDDQQYTEMKKARLLATKTKAQRGPVYKGETVASYGRRSKDQQKYATETQQADAEKAKATYGAEAFGTGIDSLGGEGGGGTQMGSTNALLKEMNSKLSNIENILGNTPAVQVQV